MTAVFFLILAIGPEAKWRMRDSSASVGASADLQTLVELGLYGAIGGWVVWHIMRGWVARRYRLETLGPAVLVLVLATLLVVTTGTLALSSRALTRSGQYAIMTAMAVLIWWEARASDEFFESFWRVVRRGFVAFALFATAVTAVVPSFSGAVDDSGIHRYGWLEIHPIATAGMLGVTLIALAGAYLGLPDRLLLRQWLRVGAVGIGVVFVGFLILTKSRGATIAAGAALLAVVLVSPRRIRRKFALLGLIMLVGLAIGYFSTEGGGQLETFVNRGQTTEQVLSLSQRTTLIEIGMGYFAERPIFGHGYMIPGTLLRTHFEWAGHAHNVALEIAMGMGLVGIAVFLTLVIMIIRGVWVGRRSPTGRMKGIPAEGAAMITMILVQGVVSDGFGGPVGWEVGLLVLSVLVADMGRLWRHRPAPMPSWLDRQILAVGRGAPELAVLPQSDQPGPDGGAGSPGGVGIVDINTANIDELTTLPGVGRRIAHRIVAHREALGPFADVNELLEVHGIGRIVLTRIRPQATVATRVDDTLRLRRW